MDNGKASRFNYLMNQHQFHFELSDISEEDGSDLSGSSQSWPLVRRLFSVILEDTKSQLQCSYGYEYKVRNYKFRMNLNYMDSTNTKSSNEDIKYAKLDADRRYIYEVIENTYLELITGNTFSNLIESVRHFVDMNNYRSDLLNDKETNNIIFKNLVKQRRLQRSRNRVQLHEIKDTIENLETAINDAQTMIAARDRYTDKWQDARTEQHNLMIENKENISQAILNRSKQKYVQDEETFSKTEAIMNKYDNDIENFEIQLQISRNKYCSMCDKRMELEQMVEKREIEMKNWIKFKKDREDLRLYNEMMTNAARCIQAWWRGLLVRLKLGPYAHKRKRNKQHKKY